MTVSVQTNRTSVVGTGAEQEIPFTFPITSTSDITVYKRLISSGEETELDETTHYTVFINGTSGGTVTTVTPFFADTYQIHIIRDTPMTQTLDLVQGGSFNAENIETALDKSVRLIIENSNSLNRTLRFPETDATSIVQELPIASTRAGKFLYFGASDGNPSVAESITTGETTISTFGEELIDDDNASAALTTLGFSAFGKTLIDDTTASAARTTLEITSANLMGVFNVKDPPYNAVGNGVADDTVAIQAAIDAAAVSGGTVYFPPGTYLISAKLDVIDNTKLEGADLGTASTIMLSGDIVGIDITRGSDEWDRGGVIIKNLYITNSVHQGTGIYVHDSASGVVISGCQIYNLASGIMISGAWVITIQDMCRILKNTRGINIYRRTDEAVPGITTIDIIGNAIFSNDTYNISVGEYSQANGTTGTQCSTLNIKNNMLDNKGNYIAGVYNLSFEGNHAESFVDNNFVTFEYFIYNASIKNNLLYNADYGFHFGSGDSYRYITIENNNFSTVAQYCIYFENVIGAGYPLRIINNYYFSGINGKICYPFNEISKRLAETVYMNGDDYDCIVSGIIQERAYTIPTTGRFLAGTIARKTYPAAGDIEGWKFVASSWGMSQSTEDTDTVDTVITGSVVTPTDFTKYKQGDYIQIDGADTAGGDLLTVIKDMDYDAETFEVYPVIVTAVTGETCTLIAGTWQAFGSMAGFSTLDNTGTPSVLDGTKFLTGGTAAITDFDDGVEGQEFTLVSEHIVKITDGTNIFLSGSIDFDTNPTDTLTLICKADLKWYETSRSDNT